MKKITLILAANIFLIALAVVTTAAQDEEIVEKPIKVVKNRQLVVTGDVYEGTEFDYTFKAKGEKIISVKIISKFADFKLASNDGIEVYPFTNWIKSYNGKAYDKANVEEWVIMVRSNYKSAPFRLVILVK